MLKILQARLQQYMNRELPDVQAGFRNGFPGGSDGKEFMCSVGHPGSIPDLGRSPREGNSNPLHYSGLENAMDRGAWWAAVHGIFQARVLEWGAISFSVNDPLDVGNLISGSSAFSKPAWTSGSSWFMYCWSLAWRILSITLLACEHTIYHVEILSDVNTCGISCGKIWKH